MANDTGQRYFSTRLCGEGKPIEVPVRAHLLDARTVGELDRYQPRWEVLA
jgi:hypothetical protein